MTIHITIKMLFKQFQYLALFTFAISSSNTYAEDTGARIIESPFAKLQTHMKNQGMQSLLSQMKSVQQCIEKADQSEIIALKSKAEAVQQKIQQHCQADNESKAKDEAVAFAKELQASQSLTTLEHCLKDLPEMMKGHLQTLNIDQLRSQFDDESVCDKIL